MHSDIMTSVSFASTVATKSSSSSEDGGLAVACVENKRWFSVVQKRGAQDRPKNTTAASREKVIRKLCSRR